MPSVARYWVTSPWVVSVRCSAGILTVAMTFLAFVPSSPLAGENRSRDVDPDRESLQPAGDPGPGCLTRFGNQDADTRCTFTAADGRAEHSRHGHQRIGVSRQNLLDCSRRSRHSRPFLLSSSLMPAARAERDREKQTNWAGVL